MIRLKGVAHFSIPVSDVARSVKFYTDVVGCTLINANQRHAFLDAGGLCVLLCKQKPPINSSNGLDYVHHAFIVSSEQYKTIDDHLAKHGVEVLEKEERDSRTVNGPRTYFRDPDGTRLEFIDLTSYDPTPG
jgi:catechol 2,3-dioxygenase-like lactoylglutathione lyase family enzyme